MSEASDTPQSLDDALSPPTFSDLSLSSETLSSLAKMGYTNPTPVQRAVFEPASRGKDLVVQARTGTGKTAAFGLPIMEHLIRRSQAAVQTLCLCPTRELALQVAGELERIGEGRQIKPVAVYGGAPMGRQIEAIQGGAQVVVGTPGRILDHIRRGTLQTNTIRSLVLDEADEMLSMGFERELSAILDALPKERQTLLFSATIPADIERMARERLRQPEFITLSSDAVGALSISHFVYFILEDKLDSLLRILETENPESAIIFCNTKADTEVVSAALSRAGFDADWLNGDLPQNERERVVSRIRNGALRFLVATDVAARGIDISHLTHVINYDFPDNNENYVHRTGRTGRAGRTGTAISLVHPQDIGNLYFLRLAYKIKPFERSLPTSRELKTRHEMDLIHSLSESCAAQQLHPDDLQLARRLLSHDRAEALVAHLLHNHFGDRIHAELGAAVSRRAKNPSPPADPPLAESASAAPVASVAPSEGRFSGREREDRGQDRPRHRDREDRGRGRGSRDRERPSRDENRPRFRDREEPPPAPQALVEPSPGVEFAPPPTPEAPPSELPRPEAPPSELPRLEAPPSEPPRPETRPSEPPRPEARRGRERDPSQERRPRTPRAVSVSDEFEFRYTVSDADVPAPVAAVPEKAPKPAPAEAAPPPAPQAPSSPPAVSASRGRPSDLVNWHPPEEDNDDQPIWGGNLHPAAPEAAEESLEDQDFALVFIDVGRREGVRPSDLQRALRDCAGIGRRETGRIRIRDRHSLIAVRRDLLSRAVEGLSGAEIAGRVVRAEQAREREAEND